MVLVNNHLLDRQLMVLLLELVFFSNEQLQLMMRIQLKFLQLVVFSSLIARYAFHLISKIGVFRSKVLIFEFLETLLSTFMRVDV